MRFNRARCACSSLREILIGTLIDYNWIGLIFRVGYRAIVNRLCTKIAQDNGLYCRSNGDVSFEQLSRCSFCLLLCRPRRKCNLYSHDNVNINRYVNFKAPVGACRVPRESPSRENSFFLLEGIEFHGFREFRHEINHYCLYRTRTIRRSTVPRDSWFLAVQEKSSTQCVKLSLPLFLPVPHPTLWTTRFITAL